jgi:hypothetical protein
MDPILGCGAWSEPRLNKINAKIYFQRREGLRAI